MDRRVTPDALEAYLEPRPGTGLSVASLVLGATTAWLTLPVFLALLAWSVDPRAGFSTGMTDPAELLLVLWFSLLPVACVGLPLGAVLALRMRAVANQWWHLVVFAGGGAFVGVVTTLLLSGTMWSALVLPAAAAAVTGRAVLWRRFVPQRPRGLKSIR